MDPFWEDPQPGLPCYGPTPDALHELPDEASGMEWAVRDLAILLRESVQGLQFDVGEVKELLAAVQHMGDTSFPECLPEVVRSGEGTPEKQRYNEEFYRDAWDLGADCQAAEPPLTYRPSPERMALARRLHALTTGQVIGVARLVRMAAQSHDPISALDLLGMLRR
jgi:hypothetical protein